MCLIIIFGNCNSFRYLNQQNVSHNIYIGLLLMKKIQPIYFVLLLTFCTCSTLDSTYTALMANLNIQLPNLSYPMLGVNVKLNNGVANQPSGSIYSAALTDRILNADFNNDGYPDAAVIVRIVYTGIGYYTDTVFVVLADLKNGPFVTNGVDLSFVTYKIDTFSLDPTNNHIIASFIDRQPGQPKAALPTVPTYYDIKVSNKALVLSSTKTLASSCYPFKL